MVHPGSAERTGSQPANAGGEHAADPKHAPASAPPARSAVLRLDGPWTDKRSGLPFWTLTVITPERVVTLLLDSETLAKHADQLAIARGQEAKFVPPVFVQEMPAGQVPPAKETQP